MNPYNAPFIFNLLRLMVFVQPEKETICSRGSALDTTFLRNLLVTIEDFYHFIWKKKNIHNNKNNTLYKESLVAAIFQPVNEILDIIWQR